jgi:hypothetical protein
LNISLRIVEVVYVRYHITPKISIHWLQLSSNGDLNLDTSLNVDNDLLDNLGWGVETILPLGSSAFDHR